ncbi:MAG: M20 metallopeptidase family protein [Oscillospiraceae bacterium]|nr:M20 family metallopeptidase [Oscillospiraceae bacterium]
MDIRARAHEISDEMLSWRRDFHAHPELSNNEFRTTEKIVELLKSFGCDSVERPLPTGAVAIIKGAKPGKCVAIRADIDALPVKEETGLPFASQNDGVMHACGHDTHISMLLATAKVLCGMRDQLPGTVKLIFQPGEEKAPMGGARPMVEAGVMENPHVDAIMATHISPGGPKVGAVSMYNGIATTAFDLYNVKVTGQNAHGSQPQNGHDAILALAQFIVNAQQIVARRVNPLKTAIVSIGVIKGGEAVNIIPSTASLEMVCRTYGEETRKVIYDEVMRLARGTAELSACKFDVEHIEGYGSVVNDPKLLKIGAEAVAEALGPDYVDNLEEPLSFSEDFSYYGNATGTPSLFLLLNAGYLGDAPHSLHDARCTFQEEALECGVTAMVATALKILES